MKAVATMVNFCMNEACEKKKKNVILFKERSQNKTSVNWKSIVSNLKSIPFQK